MQADKGAKGSTPGPKAQKGSNMSKLQELANVASQENLQDHADTKYHAHQVSTPLLTHSLGAAVHGQHLSQT